MKSYEKYKDSGVEWIGDIPAGWGVKKLKYGVTVTPPKDDIDRNSSELVAFLPMEKVTEDGVIDCSIKKSISTLYNGFTIETQNTRINAKITKTQKIIALQKEYRTALISEVVTGKIKVAQEVAS